MAPWLEAWPFCHMYCIFDRFLYFLYVSLARERWDGSPVQSRLDASLVSILALSSHQLGESVMWTEDLVDVRLCDHRSSIILRDFGFFVDTRDFQNYFVQAIRACTGANCKEFGLEVGSYQASLAANFPASCGQKLVEGNIVQVLTT